MLSWALTNTAGSTLGEGAPGQQALQHGWTKLLPHGSCRTQEGRRALHPGADHPS